MFVSLGLGLILLAGGASVGSDMGKLAAAYGALVIGAALFLGAGLAIQTRAWRGITVPRSQAKSSPKSVLGHRVF